MQMGKRMQVAENPQQLLTTFKQQSFSRLIKVVNKLSPFCLPFSLAWQCYNMTPLVILRLSDIEKTLVCCTSHIEISHLFECHADAESSTLSSDHFIDLQLSTGYTGLNDAAQCHQLHSNTCLQIQSVVEDKTHSVISD